VAVYSVGLVAHVPETRGRVVRAGSREIALFRQGHEVYALDNVCLHTGGPLGEGEVDDGCAICPWHGWRYDLETGASPLNPRVRVATYPAWVEDGEVKVWVDVAMED
jgi:nitrite reductase/ring-hydroxylating ferredoxin subunit